MSQTTVTITFLQVCLTCVFVHSYQAIANESGLNFLSVKGPELLNMVSFMAFVIYFDLGDVMVIEATE